ncbi:MAG: hypothetical protein DCC51_15085 [Anaerolineae bacterium]|nr:MAG: hypothetical protein DCC51_15085 [Anaerolineae bacterium]
MNDQLAGVIHALTGSYMEMNEVQRRRFLKDLMDVINASFVEPNADDGSNRPFFSETVRPPCCDRPLKIELSCQS